jgi:hypothetical protein
MKRCPSCRKVLPDDAMVICPYDGTPLLETIISPDALSDTIEVVDNDSADTAILNVWEQQIESQKATDLPQSLLHLKGEALHLVVEKPKVWEHRLFSQVLLDEIARYKLLKMDFKYDVNFGKGEHVEGLEIYSWIVKKIGEARIITNAVEPLINVALPEAFGAPGVAGDPESIVYVAQKLGEVYRSAIEWTLEFRRVNADEDFRKLVRITSMMLSNVIKEIEEFSENMHKQLNELLNNWPQPGETRILDISLKLTVPDMSELDEEVERLEQLYGFG